MELVAPERRLIQGTGCIATHLVSELGIAGACAENAGLYRMIVGKNAKTRGYRRRLDSMIRNRGSIVEIRMHLRSFGAASRNRGEYCENVRMW